MPRNKVPKALEAALLAQLGAAPQKRSKYGARRTTVDGVAFDSKREADRWCELVLMQKAGAIQDLERQKAFELTVNGVRVAVYKADFVYRENGEQVVEDSKGYRTEVYKLKRALVRALYGIVIRET